MLEIQLPQTMGRTEPIGQCASDMQNCIGEVESIMGTLAGLKGMGGVISGLQNDKQEMERHYNSLTIMQSALESIVEAYDSAEDMICHMAESMNKSSRVKELDAIQIVRITSPILQMVNRLRFE